MIVEIIQQNLTEPNVAFLPILLWGAAALVAGGILVSIYEAIEKNKEIQKAKERAAREQKERIIVQIKEAKKNAVSIGIFGEKTNKNYGSHYMDGVDGSNLRKGQKIPV